MPSNVILRWIRLFAIWRPLYKLHEFVAHIRCQNSMSGKDCYVAVFYFYIKNVTIFLTEKKIFFLLKYNVANALLLSASTTTNLFSLKTNLTKCVLSSPSINARLFQLLFNYLTSLTLLTELDITASHRNPLNAWWRVSSTRWRHWPHVSFQVRSNLQPARTFRK